MHNLKNLDQIINPTIDFENPASVNSVPRITRRLSEILFITSYPPRECGIATYSQDLIRSLERKFDHSFKISICALENDNEIHEYDQKVKYVLNTDQPRDFINLAKNINEDAGLRMVMVQHEFGFFAKAENDFLGFLKALTKPVAVVFHTVLPGPDEVLKTKVREIASAAQSIVVMTRFSGRILINDYDIPKEKIIKIAHGTHLVPHSDKDVLKVKYNLTGKKVLSTFGLLSSGKSIETTLRALPAIVKDHPEVMFLIIGKTHPSIVKHEGEQYREMLTGIVENLELQPHVQFINSFLPLPELLEYLQLTDIYLFTSKDPNQAVSGTFSYAISCGCPIISTPIPHAKEVLKKDAGIIFDFENSQQLSNAAISLLNNEEQRARISSNGLHRMASTAWENAAIAHAALFEKIKNSDIRLYYNIPVINLDHVKKMTTGFGMIQFSRINIPDITSGYTLDDNARALIAACQHFELTADPEDLKYIKIYFDFIKYCQRDDGSFLNYVSGEQNFTDQNKSDNLADSNGRAIWALGYLIHAGALLPKELAEEAEAIYQKALPLVRDVHSTRAMAFTIKGLYYHNIKTRSAESRTLIKELSDRLVQMYRHEADKDWKWFESYLTYANSILPDALLCAWYATNEPVYKETARASFDFLLSKTFRKNKIKVISNKTWLHKADGLVPPVVGGEQPIDVAYTVLALSRFYEAFGDDEYRHKLSVSFNWFLGSNHLHQIVYNPCTGGCYDGLEEHNVNLNQGAESTVSYLMARLTIEKLLKKERLKRTQRGYSIKKAIKI
jgi:glycosyltransferase involved in cell wall biosynthesis